jgi:hypothetical protein
VSSPPRRRDGDVSDLHATGRCATPRAATATIRCHRDPRRDPATLPRRAASGDYLPPARPRAAVRPRLPGIRRLAGRARRSATSGPGAHRRPQTYQLHPPCSTPGRFRSQPGGRVVGGGRLFLPVEVGELRVHGSRAGECSATRSSAIRARRGRHLVGVPGCSREAGSDRGPRSAPALLTRAPRSGRRHRRLAPRAALAAGRGRPRDVPHEVRRRSQAPGCSPPTPAAWRPAGGGNLRRAVRRRRFPAPLPAAREDLSGASSEAKDMSQLSPTWSPGELRGAIHLWALDAAASE